MLHKPLPIAPADTGIVVVHAEVMDDVDRRMAALVSRVAEHCGIPFAFDSLPGGLPALTAFLSERPFEEVVVSSKVKTGLRLGSFGFRRRLLRQLEGHSSIWRVTFV
jgi:hypothetical protein